MGQVADRGRAGLGDCRTRGHQLRLLGDGPDRHGPRLLGAVPEGGQRPEVGERRVPGRRAGDRLREEIGHRHRGAACQPVVVGHQGHDGLGDEGRGLQPGGVQRQSQDGTSAAPLLSPQYRSATVDSRSSSMTSGYCSRNAARIGAVSSRAAPGRNPNRSRPVRARLVRSALDTPASSAAGTVRASPRNTLPAAVSSTLRVLRSNSWKPSSSSRSRICRLSACWATDSRAAARLKCSSSATVMK